jgi:hypothetical protein
VLTDTGVALEELELINADLPRSWAWVCTKGSPVATSSCCGGVAVRDKNKQGPMALHRLHYALPGWDAAAERRDAQDELHSAAQARAWTDGDFDATHGLAFDGVGRPAY